MPGDAPAVVFYVTGHGYGHAARASEIVRALAALRPGLRVHLRTTVPAPFFSAWLRTPFEHSAASLDVGLVQTHPLRFDLDATLAALDALEAREEALLAEEAEFLAGLRPAAGVVDIAPLAVEALHRAGVPAVATTNFSWDWIYADYVPERPGFARHVARIRARYAKADLLLAPPVAGDLSAFPRRRDVGVIGRRSLLSKAEARRAVGIPEGKKAVLLSFGGIGDVTLAGPGRRRPDRLYFAAGRIAAPPEPFLLAPERPGLAYPDLVRAADVVVTKPGYGIFAECVANRAAMAHTDRGPFAEQRVLAARMHEFLPHAFIPPEDFARGEWEGALARLLDEPQAWPEADAGGGEQAAEVLAGYLERSR